MEQPLRPAVRVGRRARQLGSFHDLLEAAVGADRARVAVAGADSETALRAVAAATVAGIARPVLVGDEPAVRARTASVGIAGLEDARFVAASGAAAAEAAVELARDGAVSVLLKIAAPRPGPQRPGARTGAGRCYGRTGVSAVSPGAACVPYGCCCASSVRSAAGAVS